MGVTEVFQGIAQFGFPIVMCLIFCWYIKHISDVHNQEIKELTTSHQIEATQMTEALNRNTLVMQRLCDKLDSEELMDVGG